MMLDLSQSAIVIFVSLALSFLAGGFLRVVIRRTPMRIGVFKPKWHCTNCAQVIKDNQFVPTFSLLTKNNQCAQCASNIWRPSLFVEFYVALLMSLGFIAFGIGFEGLLFATGFVLLGLISLVDLSTYTIPNKLIYPGAFAALTIYLAMTLVSADWSKLTSPLLGAVVLFAILYVVWLVYPKGMGFGDVRLATYIGLLAGNFGLVLAFYSMLVGLVLGGIGGLLVMAFTMRGRKDPIPFGPFLAFGAMFTILFHGSIV